MMFLSVERPSNQKLRALLLCFISLVAPMFSFGCSFTLVPNPYTSGWKFLDPSPLYQVIIVVLGSVVGTSLALVAKKVRKGNSYLVPLALNLCSPVVAILIFLIFPIQKP